MTAPLATVEADILAEIADLPDVPCESPHRSTTCSGPARWVSPADPCGCLPDRNVCDAVRAHVFGLRAPTIHCSYCGHLTPITEWRKGWRAL